MQGVHLDKRLTPLLPDGQRIRPALVTYLEAGCGFGGSCFPKDLKALIAHGRQAGNPMRLLEAVVQVNEAQPSQIMALLRKHYPVLKGLRVTVLGLAFKPGTDDVRESPAIPVVNELVHDGASVQVFDPVVQPGNGFFPGPEVITYAADLKAAIHSAEAVLLLTRWPEFSCLPDLLAAEQDPPLLIDGRRMLDATGVRRYEGIGLRRVTAAEATR
jgi:UDPglucose 6-dehydrogenase/GDP-mannose 6-dehydrogenase